MHYTAGPLITAGHRIKGNGCGHSANVPSITRYLVWTLLLFYHTHAHVAMLYCLLLKCPCMYSMAYAAYSLANMAIIEHYNTHVHNNEANSYPMTSSADVRVINFTPHQILPVSYKQYLPTLHLFSIVILYVHCWGFYTLRCLENCVCMYVYTLHKSRACVAQFNPCNNRGKANCLWWIFL